ncbi:unnamed protein product [Orchesella dallaii]|uniref:Odorant receptor n=1 Tax=Orchesella dallaii TaxID=48710 RepID=A0ABP1RIC6_9HEXA
MQPITQFTQNTILKFFKVFSLLNAFPLRWNWEKEKILEILKPGVRRSIYYGIAFKYLIYSPFLVITLWRNLNIYLEQQRFAHLFLHITWAACYGTGVAAHFCYCMRPNEMVEFVNQTIALSKRMEAFYRAKLLEKSAKIRNFILGSICFYATFQLTLSPFFFFKFYDQDWYILYYILPSALKKYCAELTWPLGILSFFTTCSEATGWGACMGVAYCTLTYIQNVINILNFLSNRLHLNHWEFYNSMRIFSKLRILNIIYNRATSEIAWPFAIALMYGLFIGGFCAVLTPTGSLLIKVFGGFYLLESGQVLCVIHIKVLE